MSANEPSTTNIVVGNGIGNPYASGGSSNPFANGSPITGSQENASTEDKDPFSHIPDGNPLAGQENPFGDGENPFAGGVDPTKFSSENLPSQAFVASSQGGTTPVPEPSSMIGVAVIGLGIAAGKLKQHRRATKASNFKK